MVTKTARRSRGEKKRDRSPDAIARQRAMAMLHNTVRKQKRVVNSLLMERSSYLAGRMDPEGRDLNRDCGYPESPTVQDYKDYYDREGIATRVVDFYPEECWSVYPEVYETEESRRTKFERAFSRLQSRIDLWHYCHRADEMSGIGHYGIIVLGLDDGGDLDTPAPGVSARGEYDAATARKTNLLYLQVFSEDQLQITGYETDRKSPRFGRPLGYRVIMNSEEADREDFELDEAAEIQSFEVHWSRAIHVADNCKSSEVFGVPRMQSVFNRLFDLRKILGGSGEMFWRGAFPGYAFESFPEVTDDSELGEEELSEQFEDYTDGFRRYLALTGMTVKTLTPQMGDPTNHVTQQVQAVCAAKGYPYRVFMGSESGHLASIADLQTWLRRVARRQNRYLTPKLIRPLIDRLIMCGVLPEPERYFVSWHDIHAMSDKDKADVALRKTQAAMQYVTGGVETLIPPHEFFTLILGMTEAEAEAVLKARRQSRTNLTGKVWDKPVGPAARPQGGGRSGAGTGRAGRRPGVVSKS